eukprot:44282-Pleurochrysis_carterae.AAC.1
MGRVHTCTLNACIVRARTKVSCASKARVRLQRAPVWTMRVRMQGACQRMDSAPTRAGCAWQCDVHAHARRACALTSREGACTRQARPPAADVHAV